VFVNLRLAASGVGLLVAAGAVVAGVAFAQSPTHAAHPAHPVKQPVHASLVVDSPTPSLSVPVSSAAPVKRQHRVARSTRHAVAPKETIVSEPSSEPTTSEPASFIPVSDDNGRAGNAPPLPQPSPPPVAVPSGYNQPSS
jgi:hypothetical protein